LFLLLIIILIF
jgi:hypothetical protein